jgi:uncharacterized protein YbjT (DUF2867 family)
MQAARGADVFVHLVGVAHPSPAKTAAFQTIDLVSVQQAAQVVRTHKIPHAVYISVSQYPGKLMKEYREVRAKGEALLLQTGARCSFIRPWYVLGPGHWWPVLLLPLYAIAQLVPAIREQSRQQGLVTIQQMIRTLIFAIDNAPSPHFKVYSVPEIKRSMVNGQW